MIDPPQKPDPEYTKPSAIVEPNGWPPLEQVGPPPAPPFPVNALPPILGRWVAAESEATQTPSDMAALLGLSIVAAVIAKKVIVEPWPGYTEPTNLFVIALLDPANRKSAVFSDAKKPLEEIERDLRLQQNETVAEQLSERRQEEGRLRKLEKTAAESPDATKRSEAKDEAMSIARRLAATPIPTLIVDDLTPEKMAILMQENGEKLAVMSAEGGVFGMMGGKYSKSGTEDLDIYLKSHSGDSSKTHRVSREAVELANPSLTIGLAIQPEVIRGLAGKTVFRGRGLLARFVYAVPQSWIGSRKVRTDPVPDVVSLEYHQMIKNLHEVRPLPDEKPHRLVLTTDAASLFEAHCNWIEQELGFGDLELMRDWGGKLAGLTLRIAGIMHCIKHSNTDPASMHMDIETVRNAVCISKWAIPHAAAALDLLTAVAMQEPVDDANYLLNYLKNQRPSCTTISRRDFQRHGQRRFNGEPERLDAAIRLLEQTNHLKLRASQTQGGKREYDLSPRIFTELAALDTDESKVDHLTLQLSPLSSRFKGSENMRQQVTI